MNNNIFTFRLQECVVEEMKSQSAGGKGADILEMIKRLEETQSEEENEDNFDSDDEKEEGGRLDERFQGIDLDDADAIWENLNEQERQEFKSLVYNNELHDIIEISSPWWCQQVEHKLIQDEEEMSVEFDIIMKKCPTINKDIAHFDSISKKNPHSCIIFNCLNVVSAYAYLVRYYNGETSNLSDEFVNNMIEICENLKNEKNFIDENVSSVIESVLSNCSKMGLPSDGEVRSTLYGDLRRLYDGPFEGSANCPRRKFFLLSALSESLDLFKKCSIRKNGSTSETKFLSEFPVSNTNVLSKESRKLVKKCIKKLEYFLSFVMHKYDSEAQKLNILESHQLS